MKQIWKQRYQILETLGKGGNGQVYKVWDLHLEKEWAMKILEEKYVFQNRDYCQEKIKEIEILKKISHPNFPRIVDAFREEDKNILVMDYIFGVTLEEIIRKGPLEETKILYIAGQIAGAVGYLHQQSPSLLYLDLKPSNIMLEESGAVKIVDLGSVIVKGAEGRISGSFGFSSPEQVMAFKGGKYLKEQSDVFSFGMVLYAMAVGSSRIPLVDEKQKSGVMVRKDSLFISRSLEKIIEKCTRGDQKKRYPGMREVQRELQNCETILKKRRKKTGNQTFGCIWQKSQWYLEKSTFCTEGKHSFHISKKVLTFFIITALLLSGKVSRAEEKNIPETEFHVVIRDSKNRKVLVRKGCIYETSDSLLLEIPWKEIQGEKYQLRMECVDQGKEKKLFSIECIYK